MPGGRSGSFSFAFISTNGVLDADPGLPAETAILGNELIQTFDDGSHGDILPGDRIFSRSGITAGGYSTTGERTRPCTTT